MATDYERQWKAGKQTAPVVPSPAATATPEAPGLEASGGADTAPAAATPGSHGHGSARAASGAPERRAVATAAPSGREHNSQSRGIGYAFFTMSQIDADSHDRTTIAAARPSDKIKLSGSKVAASRRENQTRIEQ